MSKMTNRMPKGFSLQVNGGSNGGFYISLTRLSWRIALGWLAITLFFFDTEVVMHDAIARASQGGRNV